MKRLLLILAAGLLLFWILFKFFGVQALFIDRVVNESVPIMNVTSTTPVAGPHLLTQGDFQQGDSTYAIRGKAIVSEESGVRTLSFTDFDVTNGPDLFVYIVSSTNTDNTTVKSAVREGGFVNLAPLKGNKGNQTYVIPNDVILDNNSLVSIWCRRFARNFGVAPLRMSP